MNAVGIFSLLACFLCAFSVQGATSESVVLNRTRIILGDNRQAAPLGIRNTAAHSWLTQIRVLTEDNKDAPGFIVLPPLFRLEATSSALVRIMATDTPGVFPSDREGVWYVHVLTAPPSAVPDAENTVAFQVGMESVIKLFWRPSVLHEPDDRVFRQVTFARGGDKIRACNLTRYYLSFGFLAFDGVPVDLNRQPSMLSPLACETLAGAGKKASWTMINDFGGNSHLFETDVL